VKLYKVIIIIYTRAGYTIKGNLLNIIKNNAIDSSITFFLENPLSINKNGNTVTKVKHTLASLVNTNIIDRTIESILNNSIDLNLFKPSVSWKVNTNIGIIARLSKESNKLASLKNTIYAKSAATIRNKYASTGFFIFPL
jgi:hypothetical protein